MTTRFELLIDRASGTVARPAVVDAAGKHSYGDLADRSGRVAAALLAGRPDLGEARVAFLLAPGFDHVAVQWGIWRAGGIAVPIAQSHPPPEIAFTITDSQPMALVTDRGAVDRVAALAAERHVPVLLIEEIAGHPPPLALPALSADRRALIVYTSGTTGRPKGVVTTHGNIRAQVTTLVDAWGWSPADRSLHVLPLHHVHGIINALSCALWCGGAVEFLESFDPVRCWERLASGEITFFTAVPTIYARLIAAFEAAAPETQAAWQAGAGRVRVMLSGSAALPASVLERWEAITGHRLLERYGMTEIGMALSNPLVGERRAGTVGQPMPGVQARLVDEQGRVAGFGPGEIEIKSAQVFLEYWNRPDDTRRAFRDGWFVTGDVAVVEDGYWRLLGRQSVDIIKSAGYKVSALEVEEVLREHPLVGDCAVVGRPDPDLGERIGAAVTVRGPVSTDELRGWLKARLAPYKVPKDFLVVAELPRNAMGKVTKPAVKALFE